MNEAEKIGLKILGAVVLQGGNKGYCFVTIKGKKGARLYSMTMESGGWEIKDQAAAFPDVEKAKEFFAFIMGVTGASCIVMEDCTPVNIGECKPAAPKVVESRKPTIVPDDIVF